MAVLTHIEFPNQTTTVNVLRSFALFRTSVRQTTSSLYSRAGLAGYFGVLASLSNGRL